MNFMRIDKQLCLSRWEKYMQSMPVTCACITKNSLEFALCEISRRSSEKRGIKVPETNMYMN